MRHVLSRCLDLVFPRTCLITQEPVSPHEQGRYLSHAGIERLGLVHGPTCPSCGAPLPAPVPEQVCPSCRDLQPAYQRGKTLFLLGAESRTLIHTLKYRQGQWLVPDLVYLSTLVPAFREHLKGAILVPVPLHPRRLRKRGYNQSELLAQALAASFSPKLSVSPLLIRTRDTPTQTHLDRQARVANVRGAFALKPGAPPPKNDQRYVIIDDVFTTGSTLNACAETLRDYHCEKVDIATLAHG